jgi:energy-coupling factor transporter ATP-binding protein EcfA2
MISFSNINKQYGKQLLFVDASFQLNPGEKVGLVGPNGSGKTTLFRMVVGEETPDEGAVSVPKKLTIGYFRQDVEEMQGRSVLSSPPEGAPRHRSNPLAPLLGSHVEQAEALLWCWVARTSGRIPTLKGARPKSHNARKRPLSWPRSCQA